MDIVLFSCIVGVLISSAISSGKHSHQIKLLQDRVRELEDFQLKFLITFYDD